MYIILILYQLIIVSNILMNFINKNKIVGMVGNHKFCEKNHGKIWVKLKTNNQIFLSSTRLLFCQMS
jgi:hypothetical protein